MPIQPKPTTPRHIAIGTPVSSKTHGTGIVMENHMGEHYVKFDNGVASYNCRVIPS